MRRPGRYRPRHHHIAPAQSGAAVVALGANMGAPLACLRAARRALEREAPGRVHASPVWRSVPVDAPPGSPDFLNAAVVLPLHRVETPDGCLRRLRRIERRLGRRRQRSERNAPRAIDLDLILFRHTRSSRRFCCLPHPRAHRRPFVLWPASAVAADWRWPGRHGRVDVRTALLLDRAVERWRARLAGSALLRPTAGQTPVRVTQRWQPLRTADGVPEPHACL